MQYLLSNLETKKMKKLSAIIIAMALAFGLTQCKKNVETIANSASEGVHITLTVENGSRHEVNPGTGEVSFATGDVVYVGHNGAYVGTLTYGSDSFSGTITPGETSDYLYFYFLGGLTTDPATLSAANQTYTVDISDQSSSFPVLSVGRSNVVYSSEVTSYRSILLNKCALVKFTLSNGTTNTVKIGSMCTEATIDFENHDITPTTKKDMITLKSVSETEKWAIMLPQGVINEALACINGSYYACSVTAITENGYITNNTIDNTTPIVDKFFTVGSNGNVVRFAPGNLQYKDGAGWRFATNQTDYIGNWDPTDWVDLFGWGTWTGDNTTPLKIVSLYTEPYNWDDNDFVFTLYGSKWRTLSSDEWRTLIVNRPYNKRFINALVGTDTKGLIIFPDGYTGANVDAYTYNDMNDRIEVTSADFDTMLADGAVFLPQAGRRTHTTQYVSTVSIDPMLAYWSSTPVGDYASYVYADDHGLMFMSVTQDYGCSVRLVR